MFLAAFVSFYLDCGLRAAAAAAVPAAAAVAAAEQQLDRVVQDTLLLARALEACGAAAITIHGRTKNEKGRDTTTADWGLIRRIKQTLQIPGS